MKLKSINLLINSVIIVLSFSILLYAYSTGITGVTKKSNNPGCTCHGINSSSAVIVSINGPDSLTTNQTADYSITISGGPLNAAGTDIAVSNGSLSPTSGDLTLQDGELTHTSPKAPVSGIVTFNFQYTAPSTPGEQTIYANGNSVNFNHQFTGDEWNYAPNKIINVTPKILEGIENETNIRTYSLKQNFPNPFNPSTTIKFSVQKESFVSIKVYDIAGKEITTLVNERKAAGNYSMEYDASNLPSSIYFYRMQAGSFVSTKKLILIK